MHYISSIRTSLASDTTTDDYRFSLFHSLSAGTEAGTETERPAPQAPTIPNPNPTAPLGAPSPILPGDFSTLVEMTMWRPPDLDPGPDPG